MLTRLILFCAAVSFEMKSPECPDPMSQYLSSLPASALALPAHWEKIRSEAKKGSCERRANHLWPPMSCSGGARPDWTSRATLLRTSPSQCPEAPPHSKGAGFTPAPETERGSVHCPALGINRFSATWAKLLAARRVVATVCGVWLVRRRSHEAEVEDR